MTLMNATICTIQLIKMKFPLELGAQYFHFLEVRESISKLKQKCQQRNEDLCTKDPISSLLYGITKPLYTTLSNLLRDTKHFLLLLNVSPPCQLPY